MRDRVIGEWSGAWNGKDRVKFKVEHWRNDRFKVTYSYLRTPDATSFQSRIYEGRLQELSIIPYGKNWIGINRVNPVPGNADQLRVSGRYRKTPTVNGKRLSPNFSFIVTPVKSE